MTRHYRAITRRKALDYQTDLDKIHRYLDRVDKKLVRLFVRWDVPALDYDDRAAFIDDLKSRLSGFAMACDASPMRTPRQIIPTVIAIARRPRAFLNNVRDYDPEAAALVYSALSDTSTEQRQELERFEAGTGPAPSDESIAAAARKAVAHLEAEIKKTPRQGGQKKVLQRSIAWDLAEMFVSHGGRVTRSNRFGGRDDPAYHDGGPFHDFLELVLPSVRPIAKRAGFEMTSARSIVKGLREDGFGSGPKPEYDDPSAKKKRHPHSSA